MRLFEYQGKQILRAVGIPVADGKVAATPEEAVINAQAIGLPVVVKAQVLAGGRGKAGGVKIAETVDAVRQYAQDILGMSIKGEVCKELLIDPKTNISKELYAGVTLDPVAGAPLLMFSHRGGVDIEDVAATSPEDVLKTHFSILAPPPHKAMEMLRGLGFDSPTKLKIAYVMNALAKAYLENDCTTLEINPLVITGEGEVVALDAKAVIDDSARRRQPHRCAAEEPETELEKRAQAIGVQYVQLAGDIAVLAGGAGLAMATMDMVNYTHHAAGSFLDTGGGISSERTTEALRISMATPGIKGALINIFGGINNCEIIAKGVVDYLEADKPGLPVVVKMRGHSQDEGWALLSEHNVPCVKYGTTEEAVRLLVSIMDGGEITMSILVNETTKCIIQGITGKQGMLHAKHSLEYGCKLVGGVTPGRGGQIVEGVPVFNTVKEANEAAGGIDASMILVPPFGVKDSAIEAMDNGIKTLVIITEHIPIKDTLIIREGCQGLRHHRHRTEHHRRHQPWQEQDRHHAWIPLQRRPCGHRLTQRHSDPRGRVLPEHSRCGTVPHASVSAATPFPVRRSRTCSECSAMTRRRHASSS